MLSIQQERKTMPTYGINNLELSQAKVSGSNRAFHDFNKGSDTVEELEDLLSVADIREKLAYNNYTRAHSIQFLRKCYIEWQAARAYHNMFHSLFKELEVIS